MNQAEITRYIARRTLAWTLGSFLVGGMLELYLSGTAKYRIEVPVVLGISVGLLNLFGNLFAVFLAKLFSK